IVGVGRLDRQKGFDLLVEALARLGAGAGAPDLVLAGDGPERGELERRARSLGLSGRVQFLGALAPEAIAGLYRGPAIVAAPSRWEGLPLVCLEALACGAAVVAAAVDGITDVVTHDETGVLIPAEDVGALAAGLEGLLGDPSRRARIGVAGRTRVRAEFA